MYLTRRLLDKGAVRATFSWLIAIDGGFRLGLVPVRRPAARAEAADRLRARARCPWRSACTSGNKVHLDITSEGMLRVVGDAARAEWPDAVPEGGDLGVAAIDQRARRGHCHDTKNDHQARMRRPGRGALLSPGAEAQQAYSFNVLNQRSGRADRAVLEPDPHLCQPEKRRAAGAEAGQDRPGRQRASPRRRIRLPVHQPFLHPRARPPRLPGHRASRRARASARRSWCRRIRRSRRCRT